MKIKLKMFQKDLKIIIKHYLVEASFLLQFMDFKISLHLYQADLSHIPIKPAMMNSEYTKVFPHKPFKVPNLQTKRLSKNTFSKEDKPYKSLKTKNYYKFKIMNIVEYKVYQF